MSGGMIDSFPTISVFDGAGGRAVGYAVRGSRVVQWDWDRGRAFELVGAELAEQWPALTDSFRDGFDAACGIPREDPWVLIFRGDQCVKLNTITGTVAERTSIAAAFPGLPVEFREKVDAALAVPGGDEILLFRGEKCARYDRRMLDLVSILTIAQMWKGLAELAPDFASGIDAAAYDPVRDRAYLFRGDRYTSGTVIEPAIDLEDSVVDYVSWPGIVDGHFYFIAPAGFVMTARRLDMASRDIVGLEFPAAPHDSATTRVIVGDPGGRMLVAKSLDPRAFLCYDTLALQQIGALPLHDASSLAVAIGPGARLLYYIDDLAGNDYSRPPELVLCTIDVETFQCIGQVGVAHPDPSIVADKAMRMCIAPDGTRAYIALRLEREAGFGIFEFDFATSGVRHVCTLPRPSLPPSVWSIDFTLSPDGGFAHVSTSRSAPLLLDLSNGQTVCEGKLPSAAMLELSPDGRDLYCAPFDTDIERGLLVADPATHEIRHTIAVGPNNTLGCPRSVSFSHNGAYAYVTEGETTPRLVIVDTETRCVVDSMMIGSDQAMDYSPLIGVYVF